MKVALINPPFFNVYKGFEKAARIGACYPPIGLLYLAAKLQHHGHEVEIIDVDVAGLNIEGIKKSVSKFKPDLVGITATTPLYKAASTIAKEIKKIMPIPIVVGGFHVTILKEAALRDHPEFDYAVIGQGEITFYELVKCIENNTNPQDIKGIIINAPKPIATTARPLMSDLDELPYPARNLLGKHAYLWTPPGKGIIPITSIITKRGCPFQCAFCSQQSMYGRNVLFRNIDKVLDELEIIVNKMNYHHIILLDDTLIIKRDRMVALCEGIKKRKLKFTWEGMARANLVDEEIIKMMAEVGLTRMSFGIESGDEQILKKIEKGITLRQIRQAYKWAKQAGIETRGSAIIGHPGETRKSAWKTIFFIRNLKYLDQAYLNIMVPYPGTRVYQLAEKGEEGYKLLSRDFENYIRYNDSVLEVNDLDRKKLQRLQNIGLWLFYLTPRRIIYNLKRAGLLNGVRMAIAMLIGLLNRPKQIKLK